MRGIVAAMLAVLAVGLFLGSITMNWPQSPDEWNSTMYEVGWGRYAIALIMAVLALAIWQSCWVKNAFRHLKEHSGGGEYKRLISCGFGWKQARKGKRRWQS
ncbi:MAG: hypothetical protein V1845_00925 [bacterium]